ncbi:MULTISPECIES: cupredoxin domain-containing protein [Hymenobacter]|uniref:Cupredoxin-like domain-containing protein n=1 Tax=Hymenobacter mucosus TaxID=1411120 RepID=A0A239AYT0_9BACT|nr:MULTISPECIES: cupredoxin domain-containing protein [Hymenobacter]MDF7815558.1 cupredoxin domain-containing protein [Hymenobacter sp. YC55]SNS00865.1 Cupredoxin-like domain-containing protein [Hymenobacter mucosus]
MDTAEIIVTLSGLALAAFVVWYFFFSARQTASAVSSSSGVQEVDITVKGGYSPDVIEVERGKPVQLSFYRDEENSCSEELLMPDFSVRRDLPAFKTTLVELMPDKPGRFEFTCGMGMLRGSLVVK